MAFEKGKSGNPGGRAVTRMLDGRTLAQIARTHTKEAIDAMVDIMRDKEAPAAARVSAADKILNRGWGQAPQIIAIEDAREPRDLSDLNDEQLEALETVRTLTALDSGTAGTC